MHPVRIAIFGDGWRSQFYCRLAQALPDLLEVELVIGQSDANLSKIHTTYGVPVTKEKSELSKVSIDFVCVVVSWPSTPVLATELVEEGYKVYCETPPAPDLEGLRTLWHRIGGLSENIQIGEQYYRMPGHFTRLALLRKGVIGQVNAVHIASTHLYHAVALLRDYLKVGLTPVRVTARSFTAPMLNPLTFNGWEEDPKPEALTTHIATLDFGDGRYGLYDFVENQWWNPLLTRRIVARGELGEMVDDSVLRWKDGFPVTSTIEYRRVGKDMSLEGNELREVSFDGEVIYVNPFAGSRFSEDDIAVADHLIAMGRYVREEGPEIYSLADGIHDHALGLAIEESARSGNDVTVSGEDWMK
jgi:predicted dehydrogenase